MNRYEKMQNASITQMAEFCTVIFFSGILGTRDIERITKMPNFGFFKQMYIGWLLEEAEQ